MCGVAVTAWSSIWEVAVAVSNFRPIYVCTEVFVILLLPFGHMPSQYVLMSWLIPPSLKWMHFFPVVAGDYE